MSDLEIRGLGHDLFIEINRTIAGHVCMHAPEARLLAKAVYLAGDGDHLEIGSMWGGSAILAARVKQHYGLAGKVVCVDPLTDGDCSPGFPGGHPDEAIVRGNFAMMGVADRLELHTVYSSPWPFDSSRRFASALVDGNHFAPWPLTDWQNVRRVCDLVLYHDLYPHEPAVMEAVAIIRADPEWQEIEQSGSLAAWRRRAA